MGKETNLWDDSALINAFDQAVNNYKVLHKGKINVSTTEGEVSTCEIKPSSTDHIQLTHSESDVTNQSQSKAEALLTVDSSSYVESRIEPGSQDLNYKNFLESTSGEDYTQLITQYYELEEKRQSVIQQLQEAGYWNHHHEPQFHENYSHAPALPSCCISQYAAGISSVCPTSQGVSEKREKGKEGLLPGEAVEEIVNSSETDLAAVVNAWYSAGFYTGRYLLEQSLKRRSQ